MAALILGAMVGIAIAVTGSILFIHLMQRFFQAKGTKTAKLVFTFSAVRTVEDKPNNKQSTGA